MVWPARFKHRSGSASAIVWPSERSSWLPKITNLYFRGLAHEFDQFDEVLLRASVCCPTGLPARAPPSARRAACPFLFDLRGDFRAARKPFKIPMHRHAEQGQDRQITIHGVECCGARAEE